MQQLEFKPGTLSGRAKPIEKILRDEYDLTVFQINAVVDRLRFALTRFFQIVAAAAAVVLLFTWIFIASEEKLRWSAFGWWVVGALVLSIVLGLWSFRRDRTALWREQKRAELQQSSEANPKLCAARALVSAVNVWEDVLARYIRVYNIVDGRLNTQHDALAQRCFRFLSDNHPVIARSLDCFFLRDSAAFYPPSKEAAADDPGYLAHGERLREIVEIGSAMEFRQQFVAAVFVAPLPVPA